MTNSPAVDVPLNTRARILEVALELFAELGYDKTSLREIAERVGVTKAALYYHFRNKEDILVALADSVGGGPDDPNEELFEILTSESLDLPTWASVAEKLLDAMLVRRHLFLLLERNRHVLEHLPQRGDATSQRRHLLQHLKKVVANARLPLDDRVRIVASLGAIIGILGASDGFRESSDEELREAALQVVHDLVRPANRNR